MVALIAMDFLFLSGGRRCGGAHCIAENANATRLHLRRTARPVC
jgi:hypothetical protein